MDITHELDDINTFKSTVNLNSRAVRYGWLRKWSGGSVESTLYPGDKMVLDWYDDGRNGVWKTKAEIPLSDPKNTKLSLIREWKC
jgi:hypothetical protein